MASRSNFGKPCVIYGCDAGTPCPPCMSQRPRSLPLRAMVYHHVHQPIGSPSRTPSPPQAVQPVSRRTLRWKRTTPLLMQRRARTLACGKPAGAPPLP